MPQHYLLNFTKQFENICKKKVNLYLKKNSSLEDNLQYKTFFLNTIYILYYIFKFNLPERILPEQVHTINVFALNEIVLWIFALRQLTIHHLCFQLKKNFMHHLTDIAHENEKKILMAFTIKPQRPPACNRRNDITQPLVVQALRIRVSSLS